MAKGISAKDQLRVLQGLFQEPAARLIGITARQLREYNQELTADGIRNGSGRYNAFELLTWWHLRQADRAGQLAANSEDTLWAGAEDDDPNLLRWREYRADLLELEVEERRGNLVPLRKLKPAIAGFCSVLRSAGERLQKLFGPDAAEVLNEALDDAAGQWSELFARCAADEDAAGQKGQQT